MHGLSRVLLDSAGGAIVSSPQAFVRIDGAPVAVVGAAVASHGAGAHVAAVFATGSVFLRINGLPVVIEGTAATCGHTASGSSFARASA